MSAISVASLLQARYALHRSGKLLVRRGIGTKRCTPLACHQKLSNTFNELCPSFHSATFSTRRYYYAGSKILSERKCDDPVSMMEDSPPEESHNTAAISSRPIQEALDSPFTLGELSVDDFLHLEDVLNESISASSTVSRQDIEEWLILYRRLVEEFDYNTQLSGEYSMAHWSAGNYPRSVKLLDNILGQWYKWWTANSDPNNNEYSPQFMLEIIDELRMNNGRYQITYRPFNTLIRAATQRGDPAHAPIFADYLLNRMLEESLDQPLIKPNTNTLKAVLHAWAKSGLPDAPQKVETLFRVLCGHYDLGILDEPPDNTCYLALMLAWSRNPRIDAAPKVDDILEKMKKSPWKSVSPDIAAYRVVIHSWAKSREKNAMLKLYTRFVEIVHAFMTSPDESLMLEEDLFSLVISTLAKKGNCDEAEEVFELLEQLYKETGDIRFRPTRRTLQGMIIAYSKSAKPGAAKKADVTLQQLENDAKGNPALLPKRGYYVDVMNANAHNPEGLATAQSVLLRMIDHHRSGAVNMLPDNFLCNKVLTAWANSGRSDAVGNNESLLKLMYDASLEFQTDTVRPNEYSYLQLILTWSRSREVDAPKHAEEVFCEMLEHYNAGNVSLAPTILHYTSLISCWARSGRPDAAFRAQSLFDAVVELYKSGDRAFKPDARLYISLMRVWSMVGDAAKVEAIFLTMYEEFVSQGEKKLSPNTEVFNIMLEAWLRSDSPAAHQKAVCLFDSMVQFSRDKTLDVEPDSFTYRKMIEIMCKSHSKDSAEQAEKLLLSLKDSTVLMNRRGQEHIFPCYVSTIAAWGSRTDADAMSRKVAWVDEIIRLVESTTIPLPSKDEFHKFLVAVATSGVPDKSEKAAAALKIPKQNLRVTRDLLCKKHRAGSRENFLSAGI